MTKQTHCPICGGEIVKPADEGFGKWDCPGHCQDLNWDELADMIGELRTERDNLKSTITEFFKRPATPRRDPIKLLGGYLCDLTQAERLEWHEWIREQSIYRELLRAEARSQAAIITNWSNLEEVCDRLEDLKQRIYDMAKAWYGRLLERRGE